MTGLHVALGVAMVAANLAAGIAGGIAWLRATTSRAFWPLLRTGQALAVVVAAQGGILVALGEALPELHLVYGLVPLGLAFVAEQLRVAAAQTVLDQRGLADAAAVARLPEADQRVIVLTIVRREIGVMAASALVVAALGLRAAGWW